MENTIGRPKVKIIKIRNVTSSNPKRAEEIRESLVPEYTRCRYVSNILDSREYRRRDSPLIPLFVECGHPEFKNQNYSECLGQCVIADKQYGGSELTKWPYGIA